MRILCNRFNPQKLITMTSLYGSSMTYAKRWQVSLQNKYGQHIDHYFVTKPTRKQIRKLHKVRKHYLPHKCYECGKRIKLGDEFSWDELNYAHTNCIGAKK